MLHKTDIHGPDGPTFTKRIAVKNDFETDMIRAEEGCSQVIANKK